MRARQDREKGHVRSPYLGGGSSGQLCAGSLEDSGPAEVDACSSAGFGLEWSESSVR
jgi:hypothetical protein